MARLQAPFNAQQFDPTQGGGGYLPVGKHPVKIVASEIKATKDNSGGYIQFDLEVIDGPGKGASGALRVNLYSASDAARRIAESQFAALCYVTGVFMVEETAQLHNIPFAVDVVEQALTSDQQAKKAAGENVTPFTQVRKILDINGQEPKAQGQQPAQQTQQPAQQPAQAPAPQQPAQTAGWGAAPAQQPAQQPVQQQPAATGGWAQQPAQAAGGAPAWGKRS